MRKATTRRTVRRPMSQRLPVARRAGRMAGDEQSGPRRDRERCAPFATCTSFPLLPSTDSDLVAGTPGPTGAHHMVRAPRVLYLAGVGCDVCLTAGGPPVSRTPRR